MLHPRAVEIARNYGVQMVVRSSWTDEPGTRVVSPLLQPSPLQDLELGQTVDAVHFDHNQAKIALLRLDDRPGVAAGFIWGIGPPAQVDVDLIIQSIHEGNTNDIAFTVARPTANPAEAVATAFGPMQHPTSAQPNQSEVLVDREVAKVSIVGAGMIGRPNIAARMFQALADAGINLQMISTSEGNVSCTIAAQDCDRAISTLCQTFEVTGSPVQTAQTLSGHPFPPVRGVALDLKQAQLAIRQIPDRPRDGGPNLSTPGGPQY